MHACIQYRASHQLQEIQVPCQLPPCPACSFGVAAVPSERERERKRERDLITRHIEPAQFVLTKNNKHHHQQQQQQQQHPLQLFLLHLFRRSARACAACLAASFSLGPSLLVLQSMRSRARGSRPVGDEDIDAGRASALGIDTAHFFRGRGCGRECGWGSELRAGGKELRGAGLDANGERLARSPCGPGRGTREKVLWASSCPPSGSSNLSEDSTLSQRRVPLRQPPPPAMSRCLRCCSLGPFRCLCL